MTRRRRPFPMLAPASLASVLGVFPAAAQPALPLYEDVPAREALLNGGIDPFPISESQSALVALRDGRMCVLALRGHQLVAHPSTDGGLTFLPETIVAGAPVSTDAFVVRAAAAPDGRVVALVRLADPRGGILLAVASSPDMGRTWSQPLSLSGRGDPGGGHATGVGFGWSEAVAVVEGGRAAVSWRSGDDHDIWLSATTDGGATWSSPVRPFAAMSLPGYFESGYPALAIDPVGGAFHVVASRWTAGSSQLGIVAARSLDGGRTFETPVVVFTPDASMLADAVYPAVVRLADGTTVVGFSTEIGISSDDVIEVYRSPDGVSGWAETARIPIPDYGSYPYVIPYLASKRDSTDLLLGYSVRGSFYVRASHDGGSSFGPATTVGTGVPEFSPISGVVPGGPGAWAVYWSTFAPETVVATSDDDGVSWNAATRAAPSANGVVAFVGDADLVCAHARALPGQDRRSLKVHASRGVVGGGEFGPGAPAGGEAPPTGSKVRAETAVAAWGENRVFAAFYATDHVGTALYLRTSDDRGLTFEPPVELVRPGTSESFNGPLLMDATPDGALWIAYTITRVGVIGMEVRVVRSPDGGATWGPPGVAFTVKASLSLDTLDLAAWTRDRAWVVWTDALSVFVSRTLDGGASFAAEDADTNAGTRNASPRACVAGDHPVLVWWEPATQRRVFARIGDEAGSLGPTTLLGISSSAVEIACSEAGTALAVTTRFRSGSTYDAVVRRYDGSQWGPETVAAGPADIATRAPRPVFTRTDGSEAAIVAPWTDRWVYPTVYGVSVATSSDGGVSFPAATRADAGSPFPAIPESTLRGLSDGLGRLWVSWMEVGVGPNLSFVTTRSEDGGRTFGPVRRVDRKAPQGVYANSISTTHRFAALPDAALFVWVGARASDAAEALFNSDDLRDQDRDGIPREADCDDLNPDGCPNAAPVADAGPDRVLECSGDLRAVATLDGSASTDPDSTSETEDLASWIWSEDGAALASGEVVEVPLGLGSHTVVLTVTDRGGLDDTDSASIVVADTAAPAGSISSPADRACIGAGAVPVTVVAAFSDVCDPALELDYEPGPGPSYADHGDLAVTVTARDEAGNAASDSVAFTIDLVPPVAAWTFPEGRSLTLPTALPLALAFTSGDDDGAAGGVVHEVIRLEGCPIYDGATYGDRDGLLSDESVAFTAGELCRVTAACGFEVLDTPELRLEATDCGGNVGAAAIELPGTVRLRPGLCGSSARPLGKVPKARPRSTVGTTSLEAR